ncbi:MAG: hypothetical protein IAE91_04330 [Ignavibacteriaceae bacterium]|nr:hypothetical protein [Ignavibacteriaceae bacterium]
MIEHRHELSEEFKLEVVTLVAGALEIDLLESVFERLNGQTIKYFWSRSSESNLLRIINSTFNKNNFLKELVYYPHHPEIVVAISANSNFLTDIIVRNPEFLYRIFDSSVLEEKLNCEKLLSEIKRSLKSLRSFDARINHLKSVKRREILCTGVKDILGFFDVKQITKELSEIANAVTSNMFYVCLGEILRTKRLYDGDYILEIDEIFSGNEEIPAFLKNFVLISLGKLGGGELNYSSDIDLMMIIKENEVLQGGVEYFEIISDAIKLFVEKGSVITENGYLYRIDFRLRPDGKASPLCRTLNDTLGYYESRGEDWERQMLIKAGYTAGSKELFNQFIKIAHHFVYPGTFLKSPLEQIKRLRSIKVQSTTNQMNIKISRGGLRDIEFGVQALQLISGGKNPSVRESNTIDAIIKLSEFGLMRDSEREVYLESYILYRRIEHYLQLMNDSQTHTIPESGENLEKLAAYLHFKSPADFFSFLNKTKAAVRTIYDSITDTQPGEENSYDPLLSINFVDKKKAARNLRFLKDGSGLIEKKEFDSRTIDSFQKIEPALFNYLQRSLDPDITLQNLTRIIQLINFPSIFYDELSTPSLFDALLEICEFSQKGVEMFCEDPVLKDLILSGKIFEKLDIKHDVSLPFNQILFIVVIQYTLRLEKINELTSILSKIIYEKIRLVHRKYKLLSSETYFTAILGSASNGDLHFHSDVDLLFVVENLEGNEEVIDVFVKVLNEIKSELKPFDVDCRLRPEGKNSPVVCDIKLYEEYINSRIQVWELQSITKINRLSGSKKLFEDFVELVNEKLKSLPPEKIKKDIWEMRNKMTPITIGPFNSQINYKKGRGGLVDIEFYIQYLMLSLEEIFARLYGRSASKVLNSLRLLSKQKVNKEICSQLMTHSELENLKKNYEFLKLAIAETGSLFNKGNFAFPKEKNVQNLLAYRLGFRTGEELLVNLKKIMTENHTIFNKYLKN